jgi:hypothetical protein
MARKTMEFPGGFRIDGVLWMIINMHHQDVLEDFERKARCLVESFRRYFNNEPDDSLFEDGILFEPSALYCDPCRWAPSDPEISLH